MLSRGADRLRVDPDLSIALRAAGDGMPMLIHPAPKRWALNKRVAYSLFSIRRLFQRWRTSRPIEPQAQGGRRRAGRKREVLAKLQALNKNIIDSISSGIITRTWRKHHLHDRERRRSRDAASWPSRGRHRRVSRPRGGFLPKVKTNLDRERRIQVRGLIIRGDGSRLYSDSPRRC